MTNNDSVKFMFLEIGFTKNNNNSNKSFLKPYKKALQE